MSVPVEEAEIAQAADLITVQCRDPLDQKFFTLALAGRARLMVSKDKLVLKAGRKMKRYGAAAFRPEETAGEARRAQLSAYFAMAMTLTAIQRATIAKAT